MSKPCLSAPLRALRSTSNLLLRNPALYNILSRPHSTSSYSSIDPTEVSHFNALASSWWDPHGPSRLLHLMNPLRHTFISRCRSPSTDAPASLRYLDIGCGGGIFAESAARLASTHSVIAIDPTPKVLAVAEAHRQQDPLLLEPGRLTYKPLSIEQMPEPASDTQRFDVVSAFEVIEHVAQPARFLECVEKHVRPGGWMVMSTIARTWTSWVVTKVLAEEVLGVVPRGTHEWVKYVNEEELRQWVVRREGWGEVRVMGVIYVPGFGWREVRGGEKVGNYFFGVRREG